MHLHVCSGMVYCQCDIQPDRLMQAFHFEVDFDGKQEDGFSMDIPILDFLSFVAMIKKATQTSDFIRKIESSYLAFMTLFSVFFKMH